MSKGQIAVEYLIIIGILSIAIIPILFAMHWNANSSPDQLAISKGTFSVARISSSVNAVGSIGDGAKLRAQVEMPDISSLEVGPDVIVANVDASYGNVAIVQPTKYEVSGIGLTGIRAGGIYTFDIYSDEPGKVRVELVN